MKFRVCDMCLLKIDGDYIKCTKSEKINKQIKLTHTGDICLDCWHKIITEKQNGIKKVLD